MRSLFVARTLAKLGKLGIVVVPPGPPSPAGLKKAIDEFDDVTVVPVHSRPVRGVISRIQHDLVPSHLNTHESAVDESNRSFIEKRVHDSDVVWIHTVRAANSIGIRYWPHSILDIDDLHSQLYASIARAASSHVRSLLDYRMALIWRRRERQLAQRFDVLCTCSEQDRRALGPAENVHVVRNGFPLPASPSAYKPTSPPRIGFIGYLDYIPNRDGLEWFIRNVWPSVRQTATNARLRIVGRGSEPFSNMADGIDGIGYLDDPGEEIASWTAMIVPIRFGGGTRVKIAEAFSRRRPVVATGMGAFGYDVRSGEELLIADDPADFAKACLRLLSEPRLAEAIVERAWKRFVAEWSWEAMEASVVAAVGSCLASPRNCPAGQIYGKAHKWQV